ncbi:cobyrinic acid a,c-diamide synthase, partial [Thioalkalicoccus limnaeus]
GAIAELDPARPPTASDEVIQALWQMKRRLLAADRADLAVQTDRLYTRYLLVDEVLRDKFDEGELTFERARALVGEVSRAAIDDLDTMASVVRGVAGVDAAFVQRRLQQDRERMTADEVQALTRRLELIETTEDRVRELSARTEAAITALDDTAVAVSAVRTDRPRASVAADQALADLRRFVDRAHQYGHKD